MGASPTEGDTTASVRGELTGDQQDIEAALDRLSRYDGLPERAQIERPFTRTMAALWQILRLVSTGRQEATDGPSSLAAHQAAIADDMLQRAAKRYRARSVRALAEARAGTAVVIVALFIGFVWFYARARRARLRAEALAEEKRRLLASSQEEALTDALTGLANRRALMADLHAAVIDAPHEGLMLALFDLDGFKQYNDTFGHPAGDALLARFGGRLASATGACGTAYRMGGDEFCIIAHASEETVEAVSELAAGALSDVGEGFRVECSYGTALIPTEASSAETALHLADRRMYAHKSAGRIPRSRESAGVLLQLLAERGNVLGERTDEVSALAELTAARLGLDLEQCEQIALAAQLHDIGKAAIPDAILSKPGPLDADEWAFLHRHTIIGERIVRAAPSLAHAAELVRWHHERLDGTGYPDAPAGDEIPLGVRIISVSDAYDAMIGERPYRAALSRDEAIAELRRCSGTQFDGVVVEAFVAALGDRTSEAAARAA